jgi:hypothetical protein
MGTIDITSGTAVAVTGTCLVTRFGVPNISGSDYTAHLYCNGDQRAAGDTSPCPAPLIDANNFGPPCEE